MQVVSPEALQLSHIKFLRRMEWLIECKEIGQDGMYDMEVLCDGRCKSYCWIR